MHKVIKAMETDSLYYNALDLLKNMIAIPSFSKGESEIANMLEEYLKEIHLSPQRKGNNIWCISSDYDINKQVILLNSHIDTVKPVSGWTLDPTIPFEKDGKLFGLGSNDAGASVVSLLQAFIYLQNKKQSYNLIFLASCEEEISGKGGIESVLPELSPISFAVVGEPTGMNPAVAEKGLMVLDCIAHGKSGHAARNEGENAIYNAIKSIEWFQSFEFPLKSDLLGKVKMNVTMIQAGTQHNVIPDTCRFTVDVRSNECYSNAELFEMIRKECGCEVNARSFRLNSSKIDIQHPFVKRTVLLDKKPFGSPTMSDQALMPFPSVKIGPGDSARSHTADEYIRPDEIREGIDLYIRLLDNLTL